MWTAVLDVSAEPAETVEDRPEAGWTMYTYGSAGLVESFLADGVTHDIPDQADEVMRFFDLACREDCFSRKTLKKCRRRHVAK
jgi:acetylxylan esterase